MKRYTKKQDMEFYVSECLAWPLKAELTMMRDKISTKYKVGDFVMLYDDGTELRLAFMSKAEFLHLFETTRDSDGNDDSGLGVDVRDRVRGGPIDPFRPASRRSQPNPSVSTGAYEQFDSGTDGIPEQSGLREHDSAYEVVGNAS